jgi:hypothetical protein
MTEQEPQNVREEAERLVAAGLAAVSMMADRIGANPSSRERGGAAASGQAEQRVTERDTVLERYLDRAGVPAGVDRFRDRLEAGCLRPKTGS